MPDVGRLRRPPAPSAEEQRRQCGLAYRLLLAQSRGILVVCQMADGSRVMGHVTRSQPYPLRHSSRYEVGGRWVALPDVQDVVSRRPPRRAT